MNPVDRYAAGKPGPLLVLRPRLAGNGELGNLIQRLQHRAAHVANVLDVPVEAMDGR
jgi:hypothetical protein